MAKELKYDGSEEELIELGLMTHDGVAINDKRNELSIYLKEVERRNKYRANKELISAGIVDKNGKVLDEVALKKYEAQKLDEQLQEQEREKSHSNKPGIFKRAKMKLINMIARKRMPRQMPSNER